MHIRTARFHASPFLAAIAVCLLGGSALAGPLFPPAGIIQSTMKPLSEVEPRIPINAINTPGDADTTYRISQSGSYYLTGNLNLFFAKAGITIAAPNVTIDLNGFTLTGSGTGTSCGICTTAVPWKNITIRNGVVTGWGGDGVNIAEGNFIAIGALVEGIQSSNNGGTGITCSGAVTVRNCTVNNNGQSGIWCVTGAAISGCTAYGNHDSGIGAGSGSITNCSSNWNLGDGFRLLSGSISDCSSSSNEESGFFVANATVTNCTARLNEENGFVVNGGAHVLHCNAFENTNAAGTAAGIWCGNGDARLESNNCFENDRGMLIFSPGNIVMRNTCSGNAINWSIAIGNFVAPIVNAPANALPISGNTYSGTLGSTDPNANFTY